MSAWEVRKRTKPNLGNEQLMGKITREMNKVSDWFALKWTSFWRKALKAGAKRRLSDENATFFRDFATMGCC
jgi:hypothetical protein